MTESPTRHNRIFISYRRPDAQGWAGHLREALQRAFGPAVPFFDLISIPPGADFVRTIEEALASVSAVLVVIGPRWLTIAGDDGRRRLDDPADFVRLEVASALAGAKAVIPVLFGGASMPRPSDLPSDLQPLSRRQALAVSDERWEYDVDRLCGAIEAASGVPRLAAPAATATIDRSVVRVGEGLELEDVDAGDIAGITIAGGASAGHAADRPVEVLKNGKIRKARLGDLAGIKIDGGGTDKEP